MVADKSTLVCQIHVTWNNHDSFILLCTLIDSHPVLVPAQVHAMLYTWSYIVLLI
jgi:hypothetical protein